MYFWWSLCTLYLLALPCGSYRRWLRSFWRFCDTLRVLSTAGTSLALNLTPHVALGHRTSGARCIPWGHCWRQNTGGSRWSEPQGDWSLGTLTWTQCLSDLQGRPTRHVTAKAWNSLRFPPTHPPSPNIKIAGCIASLVGAATRIIFVTTKVLSWQTHVCCDKTCQKKVQTYFCHDKTCVTRNIILLQQMLSQQVYFCRNKHMFVATNILSWQKLYLWQLLPTSDSLDCSVVVSDLQGLLQSQILATAPHNLVYEKTRKGRQREEDRKSQKMSNNTRDVWTTWLCKMTTGTHTHKSQKMLSWCFKWMHNISIKMMQSPGYTVYWNLFNSKL